MKLSLDSLKTVRNIYWFIAIVLLLLAMLMLCLCVLFSGLASTSGPVVGLLLSGLTLISSLLFASLLFILYNFLDFYEREPLGLILLALAWGAGIATLASISVGAILELPVMVLAETELAHFAQFIHIAFLAPVVEELFKGLGLVLIFLLAKHEINSLLDGFLYGAMIGLGFTTFENIEYISIGVISGGTLGFTVMWFVRWLFAPLLHQLTTSYLGVALAWAKLSRKWYLWLIAVPLGYIIATTIHAIWNSVMSMPILVNAKWMELTISPFAAFIIYLIFGIPLTFIIYLSIRHQREIINQQLEKLSLPIQLKHAVTDFRSRWRLYNATPHKFKSRLKEFLNYLAYWALLHSEKRAEDLLQELLSSYRDIIELFQDAGESINQEKTENYG